MGATSRVIMAVHNLIGERLCILYDSDVEQDGSAYDIELKYEAKGWKELQFSLPTIDTTGQENYRYPFIKNENYVYLTIDGATDVYVIKSPERIHDKSMLSTTIMCRHRAEELKAKNIYKYFDDENGIGTCDTLISRALSGSGWSLGLCDTFLESDGVKEKVRSYSCDTKTGAYEMINGICELFDARPVFHGLEQTVDIFIMPHIFNDTEVKISVTENGYFQVENATGIYVDEDGIVHTGTSNLIEVDENGVMTIHPANNSNSVITSRDGYMEIMYGKNLDKIQVTKDSSNLVTRLYVEGDYGDFGYVGIDDVNPTGLPFILNYDYFRELGYYTDEHEGITADYLIDYKRIADSIKVTSETLIDKYALLVAMIGTYDYIYYPVVNNEIQYDNYIAGQNTQEEDKPLNTGDNVYVIYENGRYEEKKYGDISSYSGVSGIFKCIPVNSGQLASYEDKITASDTTVANLLEKLNKFFRKEQYSEVTESLLKEKYETNDLSTVTKDDLPVGIEEQYAMENVIQYVVGIGEARNNQSNYADLSETAVDTLIGLVEDINELETLEKELAEEQSELEESYAQAMGSMLRDGYWSNENYTVGDEASLYADALEISKKMAFPIVTYDVDIFNLAYAQDYEDEKFKLAQIIHIYDKECDVNDYGCVSEMNMCLDDPMKDKITISTDMLELSNQSFSSILERITSIATQVNANKAVYQRAEAISSNGTFNAKNIDGTLDSISVQFKSSASNWVTDEKGNMVFTALDGTSAMMLSGNGFMVANSKTESGEWQWRTFGTGDGFAADEIKTGYLEAERILAGSITTNKLSSEVGAELDLSSNTSVVISAPQIQQVANSIKQDAEIIEAIAGQVEINIRDNLTVKAENIIGEVTNISLSAEQVQAVIDDVSIKGSTVNVDTSLLNTIADQINLSSNKTIRLAANNIATKVVRTEVQYGMSISRITCSVGENDWTTETPAYQANRYLWSRIKYIYFDDSIEPDYSDPICIQPDDTEYSSDRHVHLRYSSSSTGEDMTTSPNDDAIYIGYQISNSSVPSSDPRDYIWSPYTTVTSDTSFVILGQYDSPTLFLNEHPTGNQGDSYFVQGDLWTWNSVDQKWDNIGTIQGDSSTSIEGITEHYLASSKSDGVLPTASGWTEDYTEQTLSNTNRYLWNYETTLFSNGTEYNTPPIVIATYAPEVRAVTHHYRLSDSNTEAPDYDYFSSAIPVMDTREPYLWYHYTIEYSDSNSEVVGDRFVIDEYSESQSVLSVVAYYKTAPAGTITVAGNGTWYTDIQQPTNSNPNLWMYLRINYVNGDYNITEAKHISTFGRNVSSIHEYYARSATRMTPPMSRDFTEIADVSKMTSIYKYLWDYEVVEYNDGTTSGGITNAHVAAVYGESGRDVGTVVNHYLASDKDAGVTYSDDGWVENINAITIDNETKYLWTYETVNYSDNVNASRTQPRIIGSYMNIIDSIIEVYAAVEDDDTTPPDTYFSSTMPTVRATRPYLWCAEKIYQDGSDIGQIVNKHLVYEYDGSTISLTHQYAVTVAEDTTTKNWHTVMTSPNQATPYLWKREGITSSGITTYTDAVIIASYGRDIASLVEKYAVSDSRMNPPKESDYVEIHTALDYPAISASYKYLWNYELLEYTDGTIGRDINNAHVIAVYGDQGSGFVSVTPQYCLSTSNTIAPASNSDGWSDEEPAWSTVESFVWTRNKMVLDDSNETIQYSTPVLATNLSNALRDTHTLKAYIEVQDDGLYVKSVDQTFMTRVGADSFDVLNANDVEHPVASMGNKYQTIGSLRIYETADGGTAFARNGAYRTWNIE